MDHLNAEQLSHLRRQIERRLEKLRGYTQSLEEDNPMQNPIRMSDNSESGDEALDAYDLLENEALGDESGELIGELEAALERMDTGTYGIDEKTGKPIPYLRLTVVPTARENIAADTNE